MHNFIADFAKTSSKSDKIHQHGYERIYPWFLSHFRNLPVKLLEIGLNDNHSILLWKEYFENVSIYGIDINPKESPLDAKIFKVDQSNNEELAAFTETVDVKFDIIIDDGSHVPDHQLKTINIFWKLLKPGGVYIIEDIETSYWGHSSCYDYKFNSKRKQSNVIYQFISCIHWINKEFAKRLKRSKHAILSDELYRDIEIVSFAYNSVILVKKDPAFDRFYNRSYRYNYRIDSEHPMTKFFKKDSI